MRALADRAPSRRSRSVAVGALAVSLVVAWPAPVDGDRYAAADPVVEVVPPAADHSFSLADLADGTLPVETFVAFWERQIDHVHAGACPAGGRAVSLEVAAILGATPPARYAHRYPDYAPVVEQARREHAEACHAR